VDGLAIRFGDDAQPSTATCNPKPMADAPVGLLLSPKRGGERTANFDRVDAAPGPAMTCNA
jgi:hypothetical protein